LRLVGVRPLLVVWGTASAVSLGCGTKPASQTTTCADAVQQGVAALVTRARSEQFTRIDNLPGYLFRTFKRLVLERLEIENGHRRLETEFLLAPAAEESADPDEKILIQQVMQRMDALTREVFELLLLGGRTRWNRSTLACIASATGETGFPLPMSDASRRGMFRSRTVTFRETKKAPHARGRG
jgi:hypothetical protein